MAEIEKKQRWKATAGETKRGENLNEGGIQLLFIQ